MLCVCTECIDVIQAKKTIQRNKSLISNYITKNISLFKVIVSNKYNTSIRETINLFIFHRTALAE